MVAVFYSDDPARFGAGTRLRIDARDVLVERARPSRDGVIVTLAGVDDRDAAESLRGKQLWLRRADRRQLEPGEFWPEDLIGSQVEDPSGSAIGIVSGVVLDAPQPRLVIQTAGGSVDVPFVDALVPEVDLPNRRIVVTSIAGLID